MHLQHELLAYLIFMRNSSKGTTAGIWSTSMCAAVHGMDHAPWEAGSCDSFGPALVAQLSWTKAFREKASTPAEELISLLKKKDRGCPSK